ncbi:MAG: hypothetical protein LBK50_00120 [Candidatus Nomurabacteria bacterium]|jgi:hypothetical protein|nr:hypothetical protein [Candidatus Nomurabacteria bacterium]
MKKETIISCLSIALVLCFVGMMVAFAGLHRAQELETTAKDVAAKEPVKYWKLDEDFDGDGKKDFCIYSSVMGEILYVDSRGVAQLLTSGIGAVEVRVPDDIVDGKFLGAEATIGCAEFEDGYVYVAHIVDDKGDIVTYTQKELKQAPSLPQLNKKAIDF